MDYILTGVLGFFIGIFVCLFYVLGVKPLFDAEKSQPRKFKVAINVGDTVWYQGEKWRVVLHDYWYDGSATDVHKFYLRNDWKDVAGVDLCDIKKVIRANSYVDNAS